MKKAAINLIFIPCVSQRGQHAARVSLNSIPRSASLVFLERTRADFLSVYWLRESQSRKMFKTLKMVMAMFSSSYSGRSPWPSSATLVSYSMRVQVSLSTYLPKSTT